MPLNRESTTTTRKGKTNSVKKTKRGGFPGSRGPGIKKRSLQQSKNKKFPKGLNMNDTAAMLRHLVDAMSELSDQVDTMGSFQLSSPPMQVQSLDTPAK